MQLLLFLATFTSPDIVHVQSQVYELLNEKLLLATASKVLVQHVHRS